MCRRQELLGQKLDLDVRSRRLLLRDSKKVHSFKFIVLRRFRDEFLG